MGAVIVPDFYQKILSCSLKTSHFSTVVRMLLLLLLSCQILDTAVLSVDVRLERLSIAFELSQDLLGAQARDFRALCLNLLERFSLVSKLQLEKQC